MSCIASMRYRQSAIFGRVGSIDTAPNELVAGLAEGLPSNRAAKTNDLGDAGVDTYITAISEALNTSKEQTLMIMANLDFMDSVAR